MPRILDVLRVVSCILEGFQNGVKNLQWLKWNPKAISELFSHVVFTPPWLTIYQCNSQNLYPYFTTLAISITLSLSMPSCFVLFYYCVHFTILLIRNSLKSFCVCTVLFSMCLTKLLVWTSSSLKNENKFTTYLLHTQI